MRFIFDIKLCITFVSTIAAKICNQFDSQRTSIMKTLLANYDKFIFPTNQSTNVIVEVINIKIFFLLKIFR